MLDIFNGMVTKYDQTGSTSNINKAREFLSNNGFVVGTVVNYNYDIVYDALNYGPTYISGTRIKADGTTVGHAWVIDGVRTTITQYTEIYYCDYNGRIIEHTSGTTTLTTKQVKYDWGYLDTSDNIWFHNNIFKRPSNGYNYNQNVNIISYIR